MFAGLFFLFNITELKIYTKILIGLVLGAATGLLFGDAAGLFYPVGQAFIRLIRMIIVPLVFASLLIGTASLGDLKKLGRIGARTIGFYLVSTAIAISIGLMLAGMLAPGSALPPDVSQQLNASFGSDAQSKIDLASGRKSTLELLLDIIPLNPVASLAEGNMLQIIFFALAAGMALTVVADDKKQIALRFFEAVNDIAVTLVHWIMKLAPYGVFALIANVVGQYGSAIIATLAGYFITTLLALFVHVLLFNSAVIRLLTTMGVRDFWRGIYPALMVAFSTSSSSATLPVSMECAQDNLNVKPGISSFVLPLGSTLNMDGTAIFQGVSAVFIANIYGMELGITSQLMIVLTATLASVGTAGAPQVGIIMLTMVLQSIGIPLEGIALILGVERFLDMARTTVNISSDLSCSVWINQKEG
jgi:Na+/H+-dicarboxylate symporter